MPSKTPHTNGDKPVENGINGTKDVEMKDDAPAPLKGGKGKKTKEGEEEMTVVVPPSKGSKLSAPPLKDTDGDVVMDGPEGVNGEDAGAVHIDPVAKAVAGTSRVILPSAAADTDSESALQISRATSHYWKKLLHCSMLDFLFELSDLSPPSANASHPIS